MVLTEELKTKKEKIRQHIIKIHKLLYLDERIFQKVKDELLKAYETAHEAYIMED